MQKIEVKSKSPNQLSTGANTEVFIDGIKANYVKSFKYEVDSRGLGVATVEYYANVTLDSNVPHLVAEAVLLEENMGQALGELTKTVEREKEDDNK